MTGPDSSGRIAALDLLRGIAILGILAINVAGFAGPVMATITPHIPVPAPPADEAWFALFLVLFEGKMRALFSLLFGASLLLFIDRADAAGRNGEVLQMRRLGWLALAGYLHFLLLWWGDILFTYALAGFSALAFRSAPAKGLAIGALTLFAAWHLAMTGVGVSESLREDRVLAGRAPASEVRRYAVQQDRMASRTAAEVAGYHRGFAAQVTAKLRDDAAEPLLAAVGTIGETLPLMLLGMTLYRSGFFSGQWPARTMRRLGWGALGLGTALTLAFLALVWSRHFPPVLMMMALAYGLAIPHLLMMLGYAALLVLAAPRLAATRLGARIVAAGRMAFTNYLATSLLMTFLFYGWGLDLLGAVPTRWQWPFVVGGWALMLTWSAPWLARYRQGPLEWAWRSLTQWERLPFKRFSPWRTDSSANAG